MRMPKPPPLLEDIFNDPATDSSSFFKRISNPEMQGYIRRVNEKYSHWDKIRYHPLPEGISHNEAWAAIKLSRMQQRQPLDISVDMGPEGCLNYWLPPEHQRLLHRIDQQAGGTLGGTTALGLASSVDRFLFNSLMEEAIASSQLEGATTTRDVAKKMLLQKRNPATLAERMIFNNYRAMMEIRDRKEVPLSPKFLCEIQEILTTDTLQENQTPGQFRTGDDEAVVIADSVTGDTIFTPPSPHSIPRRIGELCEFANETQESFLHPVIKAIALHFAIGYIHPFCDGNGRTARAIFYWQMLRTGYWLFEYLPISRILLEGPVKYAKAYLYTETDEADLTYFIHRNLIVIDRAINDLHAYLKRQQIESQAAIDFLRSSSQETNFRQISVIQSALKKRHMEVTLQEHASEFGISQGTARTDLFGLEALGLLRRIKRGRKWVFLPVQPLAQQIQTMPEDDLA